MYERHFGFERAPFNNVPDTSFFFGSAQHKEALAQLFYCVEGRRGFALLTGEIGAGKTTVTRALLRRLDAERTRTAVITNSRLTGVQLLWTTAREFGLDDLEPSRPALLERINRFLLECMARDENVVLLVDEAQDLPLSTLEEVRLISNLESETEKLIQVILVGQPELRRTIDHPELRQLRQRLALRFHLEGLSPDATRDYILHRMHIAGPTAQIRFSDKAINTIYRYSRGIPRLINLSCDKALLVAYTDNLDRIEQATVMAGLREIEGSDFDFRERERRLAVDEGPGSPRKPFLRLPFFGGRLP